MVICQNPRNDVIKYPRFSFISMSTRKFNSYCKLGLLTVMEISEKATIFLCLQNNLDEHMHFSDVV